MWRGWHFGTSAPRAPGQVQNVNVHVTTKNIKNMLLRLKLDPVKIKKAPRWVSLYGQPREK